MNLEKMLGLKYGSRFADSAYWKGIIKYFDNGKANYDLYRSNILKGFRIDFQNQQIDVFGKCDFTVNYWKDSLCNTKISMRFRPEELYKFPLIYDELILQISKLGFKSNGDNSNLLNRNKIIEESAFHVKQGKFDFLQSKFIGQNIYVSSSSSINSIKNIILFRADIVKGQTIFHDDFFSNPNGSKYEGSWLELEITVLADSTLDLYNHFASNSNKVSYGSFMQQKNRELLVWSEYGGTGISVSPDFKIPIKELNGVYTVPVFINNTILIDFIIDGGASDVSITPDVFLVMIKKGLISEEDYVGESLYKFADGTTAKSSVVILRQLQIGNYTITNVRASISNNLNSPLLLGQSALKKLEPYKIDTHHKVLELL